ncbi:MAG: TIGR03905 family TSCPD domain-containing protein [Ruminococcaceae bacterium]|nr:TIGR03905 family TSCPD domain-containing protein [Oscillospiraceae bacterium]
MEYKTRGTCSRMIILDIEDGIITDCAFVGGCAGNTAGIASLVKGMKTDEVVSKLKGIKCGFKSTSCPDQLAKAIEEALEGAS